MLGVCVRVLYINSISMRGFVVGHMTGNLNKN